MKRRDLITALSVAPVAIALPLHAKPHDPLPGLVKSWRKADNEWLEGSCLPDGGNFDNAVCLEAHRRKATYRHNIIGTIATTNAGLNAQLEYFMDDFAVDMLGSWGDDRDAKLLEVILAGSKRLAVKS